MYQKQQIRMPLTKDMQVFSLAPMQREHITYTLQVSEILIHLSHNSTEGPATARCTHLSHNSTEAPATAMRTNFCAATDANDHHQ